MMLPAARCSLYVARCSYGFSGTQFALHFSISWYAQWQRQRRHRTLGTVSVGGHVWPSVACNYPNANLVLIRVDTLHWERASCNQCQNDCGLTGENLWFDPCIFCHLSSRVGLESSWRRVEQHRVTPPPPPFAVHFGQSTPTHVRLSVRRFVLPSSSSSVSASFCACSRLQFSETRTAAAAAGEGVRGRGADTAHEGGGGQGRHLAGGGY